MALIRATVAKERKRLLGRKRRPGTKTEIGRRIAKEMDAGASIIDRMVRHGAREKLKNFHSRGKPH